MRRVLTGGKGEHGTAGPIGGEPVRATPGQIVRMPATVPHAVDAPEPARMLLIMLKA